MSIKEKSEKNKQSKKSERNAKRFNKRIKSIFNKEIRQELKADKIKEAKEADLSELDTLRKSHVFKRSRLKRKQRILKKAEERKEWKEKSEKKLFRRLICCIFKRKYYDEFVSSLQALGFNMISKVEYFSKRKSDQMFSKSLDDKHRLHLRNYFIDDDPIEGDVYVLAHKEPKVTNDVAFHMKGFFSRTVNKIKNYLDEEEQKNENIVEKEELADYKAGSEIFKSLVRNVKNLHKKLNFNITIENLEKFVLKYGKISHLEPTLLLIEDFLDSAERDFDNIGASLRNIFILLGFEIKVGGFRKFVQAENQFRADIKSEYKTLKLSACADLLEMNVLRNLNRFKKKAKADFALLITPDRQDIFYDDIFNELVDYAENKELGIINANDFIFLFREHCEYPFKLTDFEKMFKKPGLIAQKDIENVMKMREKVDKIFERAFSVLEVIQIENRWLSFDDILKATQTREIEITKENLTLFLNFLQHEDLSLLLSKGRFRKKFKASEEYEIVKDKIDKMKEILSDLI
jgi:hypothetical protein